VKLRPVRDAIGRHYPEEVAVLIDIVIGIAVLGLLIYRQLIARPVSDSGLRIIAILAVVGLLEATQFLQHGHAGAVTYAALAGSLLLAALFGALRAATVRVWLRDGVPWSRGNWLTAGLWLIAVAAHLGYDALVTPGHGSSGVGAATVVLYLAVSLGIQRAVVLHRAHRLRAVRPIALTDSGSLR
jgi:hypothetical protein